MTKARMFICSVVATTAVCLLGTNVLASSVATAELSASGAAITLDQNPVVSAVLSHPGPTNGFTQSTQRWIFLVDDGTGSMDVFAPISTPLPGGYTPTAGDNLTISGPFSPFNGIPEMGSPTALTKNSSGNPTPLPLSETIPGLAGYTTQPPAGNPYPSFAGHLVEINNVTLSGASGTFGTANIPLTITDGASNTMAAFYNPTTYSLPNQNLFGTAIPSGPVDAVGLVQLFSGAPELLIMNLTPVPEPSALVLSGLSLVGLVTARKLRSRPVVS
jgi:PEP-CTERM motif